MIECFFILILVITCCLSKNSSQRLSEILYSPLLYNVVVLPENIKEALKTSSICQIKLP